MTRIGCKMANSYRCDIDMHSEYISIFIQIHFYKNMFFIKEYVLTYEKESEWKNIICHKNGGPKYKLAPPENISTHFSMPHCVYTEAEKTRITLLSSISFLQLFTATSCFVLTLLCLGLSSTILFYRFRIWDSNCEFKLKPR